MPASLSVHDLNADLMARLNRRAARHGRSLEAEVRDILGQALVVEGEPSFEELAAQVRALTAGRTCTPAEDLLRESREER